MDITIERLEIQIQREISTRISDDSINEITTIVILALIHIHREFGIGKFIVIAFSIFFQMNIAVTIILAIDSSAIIRIIIIIACQPHPTILTVVSFLKAIRNTKLKTVNRLAGTTDSDNLSYCIVIDIKAKSLSNEAQRNHGSTTLDLSRHRHANGVTIHIRSSTTDRHYNSSALIICNCSISRRIPTDRCTRKTIDNRSQRNHRATILNIRTDITITLLNHIGIVISGKCSHIRQITIIDHIVINLECHIKAIILTNRIRDLLIASMINITALEISIPTSIISTFHFLNQNCTLIEICLRHTGLGVRSKDISFVSVNTYSDISGTINAIISDAMITSKQVSGYTSLPK